MTYEEAYNRIDSIIAKHEIDDEYVTITNRKDYDALRLTRKALEQELVLDKIRGEIEQNAYPIVHGVNNHELGMTLYGILQIIDKYNAESEEGK